MQILVLGGTGAMGLPLVQQLSAAGHAVTVTTRQKLPPQQLLGLPNISFAIGNSKNITFLESILKREQWQAIVDFMSWGGMFERIVSLMLNNTEQYVFISSARVYSQSEELITEETPRLLDVSEDKAFLKTNEYALAKARAENILRDSGNNNYTIIRPSITYNDYRLQLGVFEKEGWLYRALHGRSIVFSQDLADKLTTMTLGDDVATCIASIIGKDEALGQTFHTTVSESLLWSEVLTIYLNVLRVHLGHEVNVVMTDKSTNFIFPGLKYQLIYCRYFNRTFDNSKIGKFTDVGNFTSAAEGLTRCLNNFLRQPKFRPIKWSLEGVNDRVAGEWTPLNEIPKLADKLTYVCYRIHLEFIYSLMRRIKILLKKIWVLINV